MTRDLAISCETFDSQALLADWRWLVPEEHAPLMIGAFGDWIFVDPAGAIWNLSLLEGDYRRVADSKDDFDLKKREHANLNDWFLAEWVSIALENGLVPAMDQCLGWKVHPMLGAPFAVDNIQIFSLRVYQRLMGQLFRQARPLERKE